MRETTRTILTAVTIATVMALLLPVGAQAAGSFVTIVDPTSSAKAQVEGGRLLVGDGNRGLTVNGAVAARPALPGEPFSVTDFVRSDEQSEMLGSGRIAVTDFVFSQTNGSSAPGLFSVDLYRAGGDGDCSSLGTRIKEVLAYNFIPANETLAIQLSTPVVATGDPVCLVIWTGGIFNPDDLVFSYAVTGYRT